MSKCRHRVLLPLLLSLIPLLTTGCNNSRDPLVDEMIRHQATQNEINARRGEELTRATKQLVEADAESRREQAEQQARFQAQSQSDLQQVAAQRDALEKERQAIAQHRYRDPLLASAIVQGVTLLIAALPIVLLIFMVRAARTEPAEESLDSLLIHDLVAERPLLFPIALQATPTKALPAPSDAGDSGDEDLPPSAEGTSAGK